MKAMRAIATSLLVTVPLLGGLAPAGASSATVSAQASSDGTVGTFGDAGFFGSTSGTALAQPIVGMASTPSGNGYWLVASDGGIFSYGDAKFFGSTGGMRLVMPIVGMASTPSGNGYWLVAADGGIFAYGDAKFFGSTGGIHLAQLVVGMASTPSGNGYWLVAADGGIFAYGDATFFGSTGGMRLALPIVGMAATLSANGYWLLAQDGGIFSYGDAAFAGSGASSGGGPAIELVRTPSGVGYWIARDELPTLRSGDRGPWVTALQRRLEQQGYWVGTNDGVFGLTTYQAVLAVQKVNGLARTGAFDLATRAALERPRPTPRSAPGSGYLIEVDKPRQVIFAVRDGRVEWIFATSTGSGGAYSYGGARFRSVTPEGMFRIERQIDGIRVSRLGELYRPKYFNEGFAVHGYPSVPAYPASHGCVRVTNQAIDWIWSNNLMPVGTRFWVY